MRNQGRLLTAKFGLTRGLIVGLTFTLAITSKAQNFDDLNDSFPPPPPPGVKPGSSGGGLPSSGNSGGPSSSSQDGKNGILQGNQKERFAKAYTRGKFNQKGWGKIKIKQGLKFKNVSPVLIKKALQTIDLTDYMATLTQVIEKKERTLVEKNERKRQYKLQQYALSRGFETELTLEVLKNREL